MRGSKMGFSEYISIAMCIVAVLVIVVSFKGVKVNQNDRSEIKNWTSQSLWKGNITSAKLISWKQLQATHNIDYFYSFTFESDIEGSPKQYSAAGVVKVSEAGGVKKGLDLKIKYQGIPPKKIAVVGIDFD
jgi:hypothetical protein